MDAEFSPRIKDIIAYSREEAIRLGNDYIGPEHLFLGILRDGEGMATEILENLGIDLVVIKKQIEKKMRSNRKIDLDAQVAMSKAAEKALKIIYLEARYFKSQFANSGHLLLAILKDNDNLVTSILADSGVNYYMIRTQMQDYKQPKSKSEYPENEDDEADDSLSRKPSSGSSKKPAGSKTETPVLDNFGIDITRLAEENSLDPIVGREKEIERLAQILSRRKKNRKVTFRKVNI